MITYMNHSIFDEDWDYLIVLDACRYDYFKKFTDYSLRVSLGNFSPGSLRRNGLDIHSLQNIQMWFISQQIHI